MVSLSLSRNFITLNKSKVIRCLSKDYGVHTKHVENADSKIPKSFFQFGIENIKREFIQKRYGFKNDPYFKSNSREESIHIFHLRNKLKKLVLNDENIWKRERAREGVECPRSMLCIYYGVCHFLDLLFKDNPIDRFWFLETIARMPYFSYVAMIHIYETLGWWELGGNLKALHYDEEVNETFHLRIMESLGGDSLWWNRLIARHGAIAYFMVLVVFFMISPKMAYLSSELLELHAVDTYDEFIHTNEIILKDLPPTKEALDYFPDATSLYEVFVQISKDECKHAKAMGNLKEKKYLT